MPNFAWIARGVFLPVAAGSVGTAPVDGVPGFAELLQAAARCRAVAATDPTARATLHRVTASAARDAAPDDSALELTEVALMLRRWVARGTFDAAAATADLTGARLSRLEVGALRLLLLLPLRPGDSLDAFHRWLDAAEAAARAPAPRAVPLAPAPTPPAAAPGTRRRERSPEPATEVDPAIQAMIRSLKEWAGHVLHSGAPPVHHGRAHPQPPRGAPPPLAQDPEHPRRVTAAAASVGSFVERMARAGATHGFVADMKYDGERLIVHRDGALWHFHSRNRLAVPPRKLDHVQALLAAAFAASNAFVLDCEILSPHTQGSMNQLKKCDVLEAPMIYVFDVMHWDGFDVATAPLLHRRALLQTILGSGTAAARVQVAASWSFLRAASGGLPEATLRVQWTERLREVCGTVFSRGLEGVVLKPLDAPYRYGGSTWVKLKQTYVPGSELESYMEADAVAAAAERPGKKVAVVGATRRAALAAAGEAPILSVTVVPAAAPAAAAPIAITPPTQEYVVGTDTLDVALVGVAESASAPVAFAVAVRGPTGDWGFAGWAVSATLLAVTGGAAEVTAVAVAAARRIAADARCQRFTDAGASPLPFAAPRVPRRADVAHLSQQLGPLRVRLAAAQSDFILVECGAVATLACGGPGRVPIHRGASFAFGLGVCPAIAQLGWSEQGCAAAACVLRVRDDKALRDAATSAELASAWAASSPVAIAATCTDVLAAHRDGALDDALPKLDAALAQAVAATRRPLAGSEGRVEWVRVPSTPATSVVVRVTVIPAALGRQWDHRRGLMAKLITEAPWCELPRLVDARIARASVVSIGVSAAFIRPPSRSARHLICPVAVALPVRAAGDATVEACIIQHAARALRAAFPVPVGEARRFELSAECPQGVASAAWDTLRHELR